MAEKRSNIWFRVQQVFLSVDPSVSQSGQVHTKLAGSSSSSAIAELTHSQPSSPPSSSDSVSLSLSLLIGRRNFQTQMNSVGLSEEKPSSHVVEFVFEINLDNTVARLILCQSIEWLEYKFALHDRLKADKLNKVIKWHITLMSEGGIVRLR